MSNNDQSTPTPVSFDPAPASDPSAPLPSLSWSETNANQAIRYEFTNNTGATKVFTPASCMAPGQAVTLDNGESSTQTVNKGVDHKTYGYSLDDPPSDGGLALRSGTIVVN